MSETIVVVVPDEYVEETVLELARGLFDPTPRVESVHVVHPSERDALRIDARWIRTDR